MITLGVKILESVNLIWFLLSQTIYGIGSYMIMSILFQLKIRRHIQTILIISVLNSIINYLIYFNADIGYMVPIISVLITFLYLAAVLKIPMIWSFIVTVTGGLIVPLIIQLGIIFGSAGFFVPSALRKYIWRNHALDITSGLIYVLVAFLLYNRGWSFQFDFEKIRLKWERYIIITVASCAALCLPVTIVVTHFNDVTLNLTFLSVSSFFVFLFLLGYAVKKENTEANFLKEVKEHD
jgi:hypothetical protein